MTMRPSLKQNNKYRGMKNLERLSLAGELSATMAHEIKNPMTVVHGLAQRLKHKAPKELQTDFDLMIDELDRANSILNSYLALTRERSLEKRPHNLAAIVHSLSALLAAEATARKVALVIDADPAVPWQPLNENAIKQLIVNLVLNGMDAMPTGGTLTIKVKHNGDTCDLIVADTGVGITPKVMKNIFAPFYTTKEKGTGLGLPVCKEIAEHHGATIEVVSAADAGTAFTVKFPLPNRQQSAAE
ncbi:MAG: HAMP domain-containing histidine kinase [Negativicutes bacterium]|nr:HAMP domain-containing histidine kinase [Negativicutes bacterium]